MGSLCGVVSALLRADRVEHADFLPIPPVLSKELLVGGRNLVLVVERLVLEDHVQSDVEIAVVDGPFQFFGEGTAGKKDHSGVRGEVFAASLQKPVPSRRRMVLEREINIVDQQGSDALFGHVRSP